MRKVIYVRSCVAFAAFALLAGSASAQYTFVRVKPPVTGAHQTTPLSISNNNQIVGSYKREVGGVHHTYGFIRSNANPPVYTTLNDTSGTGKFTYASGINSTGYVEGYYAATTSRVFGFEYLNNNYSNFSFRGYRSTYGAGVNDNGDTVGYVGGVSNQYSGFVSIKGGASIFGVSGATRTFPNAVNTLDEVVGWFDQGDSVFAHGFIREPNGQITQIDFPGVQATFLFGIMDPATAGAATVAAGTTYDSSANNHGFLYSNGTYTQVDVPGATSTTIYGINASGWIVGLYTTSKGTFGYYGIPSESPSRLVEE